MIDWLINWFSCCFTSCFKYFAHMETSPLPMKECQIYVYAQCLHRMSRKVFFVPQFLWHGTLGFEGLIWGTALFIRLLREAMDANVMPYSYLFWYPLEYSFWKINDDNYGDVWSLSGIFLHYCGHSLRRLQIFLITTVMIFDCHIKNNFLMTTIPNVRYVHKTKHYLTSRFNSPLSHAQSSPL